MFVVYQNNKPAIGKDLIWLNNKFDTFEKALEYVKSWLGYYRITLPKNWEGSSFDYSRHGDFIEIREETNQESISQSFHFHKQVKVKYFDSEIEVDEGMVELLQLIWENKIPTSMSCENVYLEDGQRNQVNNEPVIWIVFPTPEYLVKFLNIVAKYPVNYPAEERGECAENFCKTMYSRVIAESFNSNHDWKYNVNIRNWGVKVNIKEFDGQTWAIDEYTGKNNFAFEASVTFNKIDLEEVMENLKANLVNQTIPEF